MNMMTEKLGGEAAVVTGGARDAGAAIAKRLAADGVSVGVTYSRSADAAARHLGSGAVEQTAVNSVDWIFC